MTGASAKDSGGGPSGASAAAGDETGPSPPQDAVAELFARMRMIAPVNLLGLPGYWQIFVQGVVLIAAVILDRLVTRS